RTLRRPTAIMHLVPVAKRSHRLYLGQECFVTRILASPVVFDEAQKCLLPATVPAAGAGSEVAARIIGPDSAQLRITGRGRGRTWQGITPQHVRSTGHIAQQRLVARVTRAEVSAHSDRKSVV